MKGARPSFTSRFVDKTEGVKGARPAFISRFVDKVEGQKERARPSFTSRFGAKTEGDRGLPSPLGLWTTLRGARFVAKTEG